MEVHLSKNIGRREQKGTCEVYTVWPVKEVLWVGLFDYG
jgi:hypothetical protein